MYRRRCLKTPLLIAVSLATLVLSGCGSEPVEDPSQMKVLVLGMDGLDPILLERMMNEGRLPHFSKLAAIGDYSPFGTSMPPQSPVAWSNFISGSNPGTHQIYDFIHRKPQPEEPLLPIKMFLSTSEVVPPKDPNRAWTMGNWKLPLESSTIENRRLGDAFWNHLVKAGVATTIYRMPANYPPPDESPGPGDFHVLSGMGTPDLMGSYGDFTAFREDLGREKRSVPGGMFYRLDVENNRAIAKIIGPLNYLQNVEKGEEPDHMVVEMEIVRDVVEDVITLSVGDEKLLLKEGEWTDWIPIEFKTGLPGSAVVGMTFPTSMHSIIRVYVKEVHPNLNLYVSPLQIDPFNPANPISYPLEWSAEVAETTGMGGMYTTGIPEDTKALRSNPQALNEDEFLQMVRLLAKERTLQYHDALEHFKSGFLYFYFGHTDQLAHIFWRDMDPDHPGRKPGEAEKYGTIIRDTYEEMDERLAEAMKVMDENDVLIVMSDHGFCSFQRQFNVNNWLVENGYQSVKSMGRDGRREGMFNIRFEQSKAYSLGLNCLYINLDGREKLGIVPQTEKRALMEEIAAKLEQVHDVNGAKVIDKVYITSDLYPNADPMVAPDMLIGYKRNYRASWATALGGIGRGYFEDNTDRWSGDHCIELSLVPGILMSNMKLAVADPELSDLGPSILQLFGIARPNTMDGRNIFGEKVELQGE